MLILLMAAPLLEAARYRACASRRACIRSRSWNHRQLKIFIATLINPDRPPSDLVNLNEIGILPGPCFDVVPCEQFVVPWGDALHLEAARIIRGDNLVEIA